MIRDPLKSLITTVTSSLSSGSLSIAPLSRAIILLVYPLTALPSSLSFSLSFIASERYPFFSFIAVSSRFATIYSAHGGGVLRPFSTPLTTRHPLYPLAPSTSAIHHPPLLAAHFSPFLRSRTDTTTESSFIPRACPFGMSYPFPVPPTLSRPTSSISRNLVPASLRNPQTLDAYQRREGRRTKLHRDRSRTSLVYIYSRSRSNLLGKSRDGNSIKTVCIPF